MLVWSPAYPKSGSPRVLQIDPTATEEMNYESLANLIDKVKSVSKQDVLTTRMDSSRMRTIRYSSRLLVSAQGVSAQGCQPRGCLPRGCLSGGCLPGGVCPGGCLPRGVSAQTPIPLADRMTDACENITLPELRSGR